MKQILNGPIFAEHHLRIIPALYHQHLLRGLEGYVVLSKLMTISQSLIKIAHLSKLFQIHTCTIFVWFLFWMMFNVLYIIFEVDCLFSGVLCSINNVKVIKLRWLFQLSEVDENLRYFSMHYVRHKWALNQHSINIKESSLWQEPPAIRNKWTNHSATYLTIP